MGNDDLVITEAVWRGPLVLVSLPTPKMLSRFLKSYVKIYWGQDCRAEGFSHAFIEKDEQQDLVLFLEITGVNNYAPDKLESPTKMVVTFEKKDYHFPIELLRECERKCFFNLENGQGLKKTKRAGI